MKHFLVPIAVLILLHTPNVRGGAPTKEKVEPIRGKLEFKSRKADFDGTDVGNENDPRKYIAGHPDSPQRAIWGFEKFPRGLTTAPGDVVPAKLTCSIFRLARNTPNAVEVVVRVVSHTCPQAPPTIQQKDEWQWVGEIGEKGKTAKERYEDAFVAYKAKKIDPGVAKPNAEDWKAANELAEKFGYYEVRLPKVLDGVETDFDIPAGLFRNAMKGDPETGADGKPKRPRVSVYVKCETPGLLIGMEEADFHLVEKAPAKR